MDGSGGRGPGLRKAKLKNAPDDEALRKLISGGLPPEMPGAWQLSVRETASVAGYVRSLGAMPAESVAGDPKVGESAFAANGCAQCHIVNGKGAGNGPNLSAIGARRNARHLRESLTNPAAFVPEGFQMVEATDRAGKAARGVKVNEDVLTIQIVRAGGIYQSFDKSTLQKLTRLTGQSPMPAYDKLPSATLDNLVAYLASLRGTE